MCLLFSICFVSRTIIHWFYFHKHKVSIFKYAHQVHCHKSTCELQINRVDIFRLKPYKKIDLWIWFNTGGIERCCPNLKTVTVFCWCFIPTVLAFGRVVLPKVNAHTYIYNYCHIRLWRWCNPWLVTFDAESLMIFWFFLALPLSIYFVGFIVLRKKNFLWYFNVPIKCHLYTFAKGRLCKWDNLARPSIVKFKKIYYAVYEYVGVHQQAIPDWDS